LTRWRRDGPDNVGGQGRYREDGLILVADQDTCGLQYVRESWENARKLTAHDPEAAKKLTALHDKEAIRHALGTGGVTGDWGYFNASSGWVDAAASMRWLFQQVMRTSRVAFVSGTVAALLHDQDRVTGVQLEDERIIEADLCVLAAGAWSPSLVDLAGQAVATGQVIAYVDLTNDEQLQLEKTPTILNLSTGNFIITPANNVLKIARHAYGYLNPMPASPIRSSDHRKEGEKNSMARAVSAPMTATSYPGLEIPLEGSRALRQALHDMVPFATLKDRPFSRTRLCWYTDTPTGDFLVDYHPHWQGLFIATGGSGHAFKFLPVLGQKVVDCILGNESPTLREKWAWKQGPHGQELEEAAVVTEDGTRGGVAGLLLQAELAKV
jgi:sarcosine oxidase / L-pipecolate oxidase